MWWWWCGREEGWGERSYDSRKVADFASCCAGWVAGQEGWVTQTWVLGGDQGEKGAYDEEFGRHEDWIVVGW